MDYTYLKDFISYYTGLEKDALHIHVALFLYLLVLVVFRRSRRSFLPWLVVFGIELANEAHDLWLNWTGGPAWAIGESVKDLWNTMLWPTVLYVIGRYTDWSPGRRKAEPEAGAAPPGAAADESDAAGPAADR